MSTKRLFDWSVIDIVTHNSLVSHVLDVFQLPGMYMYIKLFGTCRLFSYDYNIRSGDTILYKSKI